MISRPLKLGFLASGNGSSAQATVTAIAAGRLEAQARVLVSNKKDCAAFGWAHDAGVPFLSIPTVTDPDAADARLQAAMDDHGVELIVLSGYLRRLGPRTLSRFAGRILNIHPGPLPQFGGEGMYGARVHQAVIAAGVAERRAAWNSSSSTSPRHRRWSHGRCQSTRVWRSGHGCGSCWSRSKFVAFGFSFDVT